MALTLTCEIGAESPRDVSEVLVVCERRDHRVRTEHAVTHEDVMLGGTGLIGLKDRVEALNGKISVESPPGGGTSLVVTLPLGEAAQ